MVIYLKDNSYIEFIGKLKIIKQNCIAMLKEEQMLMNKNAKCSNCKYYYSIGEWSIPKCKIADNKKDDTLLILGKKGACLYHEYEEYYGCK